MAPALKRGPSWAVIGPDVPGVVTSLPVLCADVRLGDLGPAAAAQAGRGIVLFCCSDNEDEDPAVLLRASAGDPQCTARLSAEPHPEPEGSVADYRHAGHRRAGRHRGTVLVQLWQQLDQNRWSRTAGVWEFLGHKVWRSGKT